MKKLSYNNSKDGNVAISILLIHITVLLGIMVTWAQLGLGQLQVSLALSKGEDTLHFVEGCTEDYLLKIRSQGASFVAGNITRPEGTCTIIVNSGNPNWDITVSTNATTYKRSIRVVFTRNATGITLTSWKEQ